MTRAWPAAAQRQGDVALVALVMGVLVVLFTPVPAALLDFLILLNFAFAFLILLLTFYVARPVDFSTFPSLLLVATLFRLSLNVAATRLILSDADAGRVIGAIGAHVVGGNYVIGFTVFLILVVVQYVVVTNGAQRVSEVAARFTLDSMPGQQMSIDADLNMGFIDQVQAQQRRRNLEKEAGFYGAMDGASKFVKGDAIAGILILAINILGGMVIGVMQRGLSWSEALATYTLLTIGDGIVTQVPALVIAVGTGIIVTRSASDANLSREVLRQVTAFPKALVLVAMALAVLLVLPGIPALPAAIVLSLTLTAGWLASRDGSRDPGGGATPSGNALPQAAAPSMDADPYAPLAVEPVVVHAGARLAAVAVAADSPLAERISSFRRQHAIETGVVLPNVRVREASRLEPDQYEIQVDGVVAGRGEARSGRWLAIHPSGDVRSVAGDVTRDPSYGLPAVWIEPAQRDEAVVAGYTTVDAITVFMTHLTEVLRRESAALLSRAEVERLVERVRKVQPGLVEELVPTVLSITDVQRVLQALLREKVSVRHIEAILETLADAGRASKDPSYLVERVRERLGPSICQGLMGDTPTLHVLTLDAALEGQLLLGVREAGSPPMVDPHLAQQLLTRLVEPCERMMKNNLLPVLLCAPDLRRHLRSVCERALPHLRVLSMCEVPPTVDLRSYGVVGSI